MVNWYLSKDVRLELATDTEYLIALGCREQLILPDQNTIHYAVNGKINTRNYVHNMKSLTRFAFDLSDECNDRIRTGILRQSGGKKEC